MYSKQNIHYALRSSLMSRRRVVGTLELFNSKSRGDFTDKQLRTQKLIAPHIASHLALLLAFEEKTSSTPTVNQEEIKEAYHLTSREVEIVSMIATGLEDSEIIDILCISESTFKKHLYNAYRKMNVSSRSQLYNQLLKR